jgi:hypothetical protein
MDRLELDSTILNEWLAAAAGDRLELIDEDGNLFGYFDPTFEPPHEIVGPVIPSEK